MASHSIRQKGGRSSFVGNPQRHSNADFAWHHNCIPVYLRSQMELPSIEIIYSSFFMVQNATILSAGAEGDDAILIIVWIAVELVGASIVGKINNREQTPTC